MQTLWRIAAYAIMGIAASHVAQLFLMYDELTPVIQLGMLIVGWAWFVIGFFLLRESRTAAWIAIFVTAIGGIGATIRLISYQFQPFGIFHVMLDAVVVSICIYLLIQTKQQKQNTA